MLWRIAPFALLGLALAAGVRSSAPDTAGIDRDLIAKGKAAWRKQDKNGRSCIGCHSPLGLELAFYDFDDDNLLRRAGAHVSAADAQAIVGMIHARRREYKIYRPLDAMADRPLQPGGEVLPGETPAERDAAFGRELDAMLPLLTRGQVDSLAKAREVQREVLAVNLRELKIGIPMNRLSEDVFHGLEHATVADWIPDTPVPLTPEAARARDAYEADPSDAHLQALIQAVPASPPMGKAADQLAMAKYRALLRLQAQLAHPDRNELGPRLRFDSPYWDVAEVARMTRGLPLTQFGLPDDIRRKKEPGPTSYQQLTSMRLPWYWIGWINDPGLQHTGPSAKSMEGLYFGFALLDDGPYPMHAAFMFLRKQLSQAFDPAAWSRLSPQHDVLEYSSFLAGGNFRHATPVDPAAAAIYRRFVVNEFRTSLFLLLDETRRRHMTDLQKPELAESRQMADYIEAELPASKPSTERLLAEISDAFKHAEQMRG